MINKFYVNTILDKLMDRSILMIFELHVTVLILDPICSVQHNATHGHGHGGWVFDRNENEWV